jgi:hypothetical protein
MDACGLHENDNSKRRDACDAAALLELASEHGALRLDEDKTERAEEALGDMVEFSDEKDKGWWQRCLGMVNDKPRTPQEILSDIAERPQTASSRSSIHSSISRASSYASTTSTHSSTSSISSTATSALLHPSALSTRTCTALSSIDLRRQALLSRTASNFLFCLSQCIGVLTCKLGYLYIIGYPRFFVV